MVKASQYTSGGTKGADVKLPKQFEGDVNLPLLAQAIRVYESNSHTGKSRVKTRGEVSLTKAKWYRQKGTGRARHGAKSAPIFVGGGKAHGPKGKKRELKLSKKMKVRALNSALSMKAKNDQVVVVSSPSKLKKTKEAQKLVDKIAKDKAKDLKNPKFTFVLSEKGMSAKLAIRNLAKAEVYEARNMNAYIAYFGGVLIFDKDALNTKTQKPHKSTKK